MHMNKKLQTHRLYVWFVRMTAFESAYDMLFSVRHIKKQLPSNVISFIQTQKILFELKMCTTKTSSGNIAYV